MVADAYAHLRQALVEGGLAPGSRLSEASLAQRLGHSRSSVRAALQRLQVEGYLEAEQRGTRSLLVATPLTKREFIELSEVVSVLEGLAAERASRLPDDERDALCERLTSLNEDIAARSGDDPQDRTDVLQLDAELHRAVVVAAANERLLRLFETVKPQMRRYQLIYLSVAARIQNSVREHQALIAGIRAGDATAAFDAMRANEMNAARHMLRHIDHVGERGVF